MHKQALLRVTMLIRENFKLVYNNMNYTESKLTGLIMLVDLKKHLV